MDEKPNKWGQYDAKSCEKTGKKLMQLTFIPLVMPVIMDSQLWFMQLCIKKLM